MDWVPPLNICFPSEIQVAAAHLLNYPTGAGGEGSDKQTEQSAVRFLVRKKATTALPTAEWKAQPYAKLALEGGNC